MSVPETELEYRRLPQDVKPINYSIQLSHLLLTENDLTYKGRVDIELDVHKCTDRIILNAHKLRNVSASVTGIVDVDVTLVSRDDDSQRLIVHLSKELAVGSKPVHLSLTYEATIDDHLTGFYRSCEGISTTGGTKGTAKHMFCTQFQPSDARRAFPCFDEPDFKATFDLSVEVPQCLTVLSNMPEKSTILSKEQYKRKTVSFRRTPVMSTYLLAWAIGELECIETVISRRFSDEPLPIRVYTSPGLLEYGEFALHLAGRVIDYFAQTFNIDYPLPKLDLLAVTEMSDDAMENWGLVIFRSTALLLDEKLTEPRVRTQVTYVIAHELAHQWFGNLVTMTWWDELWLNEGFATWAGWDACDFLHPEWDVWGLFVAEGMQEALELDSLTSSHPVQVPILDGLEVDSVFDSISYSKGASIVRMLVAYLDRDVFLQGVCEYLSAHLYQNATADRLWAALEKSSGKDVARLIEPWIKKMGFPVVSVQHVGCKSVRLQQSPILPSDRKSSWFIPLLVQTSKGVVKRDLATCSGDFEVASDVITINHDQQCFYRIQFTDCDLVKMSQSLDNLSMPNQAGLLTDAMSMTFVGRCTSTSTVLTLIERLSQKADLVVWTSILSCLRQIRCTFSADPEINSGLRAFTRRLVVPAANRLGWSLANDESYKSQRLRPLLLTEAGISGDEQTVAKACQLFEAIRHSDETAMHPFLRPTVFAIGTSQNGNEALSLLRERYQKTSSPHEREAIAMAMSQISDSQIAREFLKSQFTGQMAAQDLLTMTIAMADNAELPGVVWAFVRDEWDLVCERLAGSMAIFEPFVRSCLRPANSNEGLQEVTEFFAGKQTMGFRRGLTVALESIRAKVEYRARDEDSVRNWLKASGDLSTQ